jgi:excisionase family DNA binding protein
MKVFTVSQACKYCNVSPKTIVNWVEAGYLKAYKTVGGHRRIKKEDLDAFMREHNMPIFEEAFQEGPKRILVVDDDRIVLETIVQSLEEDEYGYELISASDGFEAGVQLSHFKPDLVILDIMMPDINGYEVCKKIKANPDTKDTKIIVLSGYLDEENFRRMKEYGADCCFSKPLPLDRLKREVATILGLAP